VDGEPSGTASDEANPERLEVPTEEVPTEEPDVEAPSAEEPPGEASKARDVDPVVGIDSDEKIEVRVSSKHLVLASQVFRVMLEGSFLEGRKSDAQELKRVPLPDDDADAMLLLLSIVHGLTRRVPRRIKNHLFLNVVILIDKYQLNEATEICTDIWFDVLWKSVPQNLYQDLANWIYSCWVLRKEEEFKNLTRLAQFERGSRFEDGDTLFPGSITGMSQKWSATGKC